MRLTRKDVSLGVARLMPHILRGIQLEFFVRRGVTQTQFLVMGAIRAYTRCPMGTLARNLHVTMPTASGIVERLVRSGFVRRVPQADDRRQVLVELTPKGRAFFQDFEQVVRRRWEEALVSLEPHELAAFHEVVTKLRGQLQAAGR
ncbi:MAG: MarR family transcriptional regulator [Candidatus Omnitrophica bacterium]|nr:MarR family transcriptional regulator [Candidatus Omnitrophota bacterium]